ncbi:hypothetical protein [Streptomyces sp. HD]|uniref:hypothetical protein n=1 Tax=Streptomyces sp. HD TaxID=3020892 RepID=UPI00232C8DD9|nr:hypothetical protein [Streptomyces sp. HD]MDC0773489.1 hypothetical protein [Streptomyces sp. HD]
MSLIKKSGVAVTAMLAASLSVVATAPAAHAAAGDTAPSCVDREVFRPTSNDHITVYLTNNCSTSKKVKVDIRLGKDSPCWTLAPGDEKRWTYDGLGDYRKTVLC